MEGMRERRWVFSFFFVTDYGKRIVFSIPGGGGDCVNDVRNKENVHVHVMCLGGTTPPPKKTNRRLIAYSPPFFYKLGSAPGDRCRNPPINKTIRHVAYAQPDIRLRRRHRNSRCPHEISVRSFPPRPLFSTTNQPPPPPPHNQRSSNTNSPPSPTHPATKACPTARNPHPHLQKASPLKRQASRRYCREGAAKAAGRR